MLVANKSSNVEFRSATQKGGIGNAYFIACSTSCFRHRGLFVSLIHGFPVYPTMSKIDRSKGGNRVVAIIAVLPNNLPSSTSPDDNKSRHLILQVYHDVAKLRCG